MAEPLFPSALTAPIIYTDSRHDRGADTDLDDIRLAHLGRDPLARWLVWWRGRFAVGDGGTRPLMLTADIVAPWLTADRPWVHLGRLDGAPVFAVDLSALDGAHGPSGSETGAESGPSLSLGEGYLGLRAFAVGLDGGLAVLLVHAQSLFNWHARHRFCAVCGKPSVTEAGGRHRRCSDPECNAQHFPRTDPVVIMLVTDPDRRRILLADHGRGPSGMISTIAGFVEPGETLEDAVIRETHEETGLEVDSLRYVASQPWPWPSNLMLAFVARAKHDRITVDPRELRSAAWYTRDEVRAMRETWQEGPGPKLPGMDAVARRLVMGWLEGVW